MSEPKKIFWLAGESSGDLHASLVMQRLNQDIPNLEHSGIGGSLMQRQGLKILYPFDRFAVMGFVEVLKHLYFFLGVERKVKSYLRHHKPDLVILVDYPGLNLRIASISDEERIPVLYFICPQFWAWKRKRVYKLRNNVRHVACILPFEKELLDIYNVSSSYVGHPIAEEIKLELDRESFAAFYKLDPSRQWIAFLPGSRKTEVERLLPSFIPAAKELEKQGYQVLISRARHLSPAYFNEQLASYDKTGLTIVDGYNYELMKYSKLVIACSGTATLETAFLGTPVVICYKASYLSYRIGRYFVRIKRIGLPNIILEEDLLPELVQDQLSSTSILQAASELLKEEKSRKVRKRLLDLRGELESKKCSVEMSLLVRKLLGI
ncbi:MAG: lipid-A-disaccharide synthase [Candidatus Cloacimonadota bacterium]